MEQDLTKITACYRYAIVLSHQKKSRTKASATMNQSIQSLTLNTRCNPIDTLQGKLNKS